MRFILNCSFKAYLVAVPILNWDCFRFIRFLTSPVELSNFASSICLTYPRAYSIYERVFQVRLSSSQFYDAASGLSFIFFINIMK